MFALRNEKSFLGKAEEQKMKVEAIIRKELKKKTLRTICHAFSSASNIAQQREKYFCGVMGKREVVSEARQVEN
jgi:hypothetical protein